MNFSNNTDTGAEVAQGRAVVVTVLAREAGMPFQPPLGIASGVDPIAEEQRIKDARARGA